MPGDAPAALPGRKLGGILIETVQAGGQRIAVVGVGLNILPLPPRLATDTAAPEAALSWGYACGQELLPGLTAPAALARVAPALVRALLAFEREGFAPLQARFAARDVLAGRWVRTTLAGLQTGLADGVDHQGTLWLRVGSQRLPVSSGEVSLRLDAAPEPAAVPGQPEGGAAAC